MLSCLPGNIKMQVGQGRPLRGSITTRAPIYPVGLTDHLDSASHSSTV